MNTILLKSISYKNSNFLKVFHRVNTNKQSSIIRNIVGFNSVSF